MVNVSENVCYSIVGLMIVCGVKTDDNSYCVQEWTSIETSMTTGEE